MGRGEEKRDRHTKPKQRHALAADCIQDRDHVVHHTLKEATLLMVNPIRRARATRIEPDMTRKRGHPVEKPHQPRLLPHHVDGEVRRPAHQHVDRTITDDLIGNPVAINGSRELSWRSTQHSHRSPPSEPNRHGEAASVTLMNIARWTHVVIASLSWWARVREGVSGTTVVEGAGTDR